MGKNKNSDQLGSGEQSNILSPKPIGFSNLKGKNITHIASCTHHSIAIADGKAFSWGKGGLTGDGTQTQRLYPIEIDTRGILPDAIMKRALCHPGGRFSLLEDTNGHYYSFGLNEDFQLGDLSLFDRNLPVVPLFPFQYEVKYAVAGRDFVLFQTKQGKVLGFGNNRYGQLGLLKDDANVMIPEALYTDGALNGKEISQIACGSYHTLILCTDGTLFGTGGNEHGELGNGIGGCRSSNRAGLPRAKLSLNL